MCLRRESPIVYIAGDPECPTGLPISASKPVVPLILCSISFYLLHFPLTDTGSFFSDVCRAIFLIFILSGLSDSYFLLYQYDQRLADQILEATS